MPRTWWFEIRNLLIVNESGWNPPRATACFVFSGAPMDLAQRIDQYRLLGIARDG
ncbi:MAG: hypothetical protein L0Y60_02165 [Beijerinckiaceae bacterium]|nr:hypothetical protein [Beijerinckiaceae bacterium]